MTSQDAAPAPSRGVTVRLATPRDTDALERLETLERARLAVTRGGGVWLARHPTPLEWSQLIDAGCVYVAEDDVAEDGVAEDDVAEDDVAEDDVAEDGAALLAAVVLEDGPVSVRVVDHVLLAGGPSSEDAADVLLAAVLEASRTNGFELWVTALAGDRRAKARCEQLALVAATIVMRPK
jgi:hypothetical protein